jgi:hypothetical protein
MTKIEDDGIENASSGKRIPWETPKLLRIEAGSAEAVDNQGGGDGGIAPTHKS